MKLEILYRVRCSRGRELTLLAANSAPAKRRFCRAYGFRPSDPWTGELNLSAHRLSPEETAARKAQAEDRRSLAVFLEGALEIACKARECATHEA